MLKNIQSNLVLITKKVWSIFTFFFQDESLLSRPCHVLAHSNLCIKLFITMSGKYDMTTGKSMLLLISKNDNVDFLNNRIKIFINNSFKITGKHTCTDLASLLVLHCVFSVKERAEQKSANIFHKWKNGRIQISDFGYYINVYSPSGPIIPGKSRFSGSLIKNGIQHWRKNSEKESIPQYIHFLICLHKIELKCNFFQSHYHFC